METKQVLAALAALAHDSRLKVFRRLVQAGPTGMAAGEIGAAVHIAPTTLSFHLKEMANAGLVSARQEGRYIYYAANYAGMNALIAYLTENCCESDCGSTCQPAGAKRRAKERSLK